ncbi:MAG: FHA domain-containing protein [Phycisphaerae bacterium]|nr:FHA domain-containing protein [Phycisphaerae bacterium]
MLEVTITSKDGKTLKRYELTGSRPLQVGRGSVCDIQVPLMDVSREHATLEPVGDVWVLKDRESTHGCVVEGERVRAVPVSAGLEVRLGSARMRFSNLADRIGAELNAILEEADPNAATGEPMESETLPRMLPNDHEPERKKSWRLRWAS